MKATMTSYPILFSSYYERAHKVDDSLDFMRKNWYQFNKVRHLIDPQIGRNTMYSYLRYRGIFDRDNKPTAKYMGSYFRNIPCKNIGSYTSHIPRNGLTVISIEGMSFIRKNLELSRMNGSNI
jgi:hypothetical protein